MAFEAKILADSLNPEGSRLTTMVLTYPRCIHSEFMTHRMFSRNAASSRAIPITKMIKAVEDDPFIPIVWGSNKKGMQAGEEIPPEKHLTAKINWLQQRDLSILTAKELIELGLHKQIVNRILEPWMWITVIATADDRGWENFFHLRCDPMAEPHIQKIAYMAREIYDHQLPHAPAFRNEGWHLPLTGFAGDEELSLDDAIRVSVGRCARVSYLTHEGKRDIQADIDLHDRLMESGHWSPFEHVARYFVKDIPRIGGAIRVENKLHGNFHKSWEQYRKTFQNECCNRAERNPE